MIRVKESYGRTRGCLGLGNGCVQAATANRTCSESDLPATVFASNSICRQADLPATGFETCRQLDLPAIGLASNRTCRQSDLLATGLASNSTYRQPVRLEQFSFYRLQCLMLVGTRTNDSTSQAISKFCTIIIVI